MTPTDDQRKKLHEALDKRLADIAAAPIQEADNVSSFKVVSYMDDGEEPNDELSYRFGITTKVNRVA